MKIEKPGVGRPLLGPAKINLLICSHNLKGLTVVFEQLGSTWAHLGPLRSTLVHFGSLEALDTRCGGMGRGYSPNDENGRSIRMLYDEHKDVICTKMEGA